MPGTPGNPPSGHLVQTFEDAIATFNAAQTDGDYSNFIQYLYPTDVYIQKVDDPGGFEEGTPADIVSYLNTQEAQTGYFPQFFYDHDPPHHKEHKNYGVGDVTGTGKYQDKYTDNTKIPVQFCLRFKKRRDIWLLVTALVVPI